MMKNKIYIILIAFMGVFTSCEDFLNEQPKGVFIPTDVEHFESLMISYNPMQGRFNPMLILMSDQIISDDANLAYVDVDVVRRYARTDYVDVSISESNDLWEVGYERIFIYNSIIEEAEAGNINGTDEEVNQLVAMARAARAYEYFDLVNMFGKSYNEASSSSDLGVPIVTSPDVSEQIPNRSTVKAVYDYMISEVSESIDDLPETGYNKTMMPGKDMAYAFLSRVYLFMHDYAKAKESADLALAIKNNIYDYNNTFPDILDNPEVIYAKERFNFVRRISFNPWMGVGFSLNPDFVNAFEAGDIRFANISRSGTQDANGNLYLDPKESEVNIGLSVPELYLIKSECNARLASGSLQDILNDLNAVRANRFPTGTYVDLTTDDIADKSAALSFALNERRKELAFRDMRMFDMRRLMVTGDYTKTLTRTVLGKNYSIAPNANNWVLNIPLKVMDFNPGWEQNPRDGVSIIE